MSIPLYLSNYTYIITYIRVNYNFKLSYILLSKLIKIIYIK